jgi:hypothetical protein
MTHPFALSIDDLACLELVDETAPLEGGANLASRFITYGINEGGITYRMGEVGLDDLTYRFNEGGHNPPPVFTSKHRPEHGGPILDPIGEP